MQTNPNIFQPNQMQANNYYPTQPSYQQPVQQEYYVGIGGQTAAVNYPIAPGSTIWLVDAVNHKVYEKVRDFQGGSISMREFDLVEVVANNNPNVESQAFEELQKQIEDLKTELLAIKPIIEELKS